MDTAQTFTPYNSKRNLGVGLIGQSPEVTTSANLISSVIAYESNVELLSRTVEELRQRLDQISMPDVPEVAGTQMNQAEPIRASAIRERVEHANASLRHAIESIGRITQMIDL